MGLIKKIFLGLLAFLLIVDSILVVYATTANVTILNPTFIEQELENRNLYSILKEQAIDALAARAEEPPPPWIVEVLKESVTEDWMKKQAHVLIPSLLAYIKSETHTPDLRVSTVELKNNFKANLREAVIEHPPPELRDQPPEKIEEFLAEVSEQIDVQVPDEIDVTELVGSEQLEPLKQARIVVGYFYTAYYVAMALTGLFIVLIVLICREVKSVSRIVGASALIGGVASYAISLVAVSLVLTQIPTAELPSFVTEEMILGLMGDILAPARTYAIVLSVVGLVLVVFSVVQKSLYSKRRGS